MDIKLTPPFQHSRRPSERNSLMDRVLDSVNLHLHDITRCPPEWHVISERDPFHRLYWVYGGDVVYRDATRCMRLLPGNLYLFPTRAVYDISQHPSAPLECLWFHFTMDRTLPDEPLVHAPGPESSTEYLLMALAALVREKAAEPVFAGLIPALLHGCFSDHFSSLSGDMRLEPVLCHIRSHLAESFDNGFLAGLAGFNVRYFIRLFKKSYGKTPQEYVASSRCFLAERLLLQGVQVQDAAERTGFGDAKAFSRFFRKRTGVSPTDYKRRKLP